MVEPRRPFFVADAKTVDGHEFVLALQLSWTTKWALWCDGRRIARFQALPESHRVYLDHRLYALSFQRRHGFRPSLDVEAATPIASMPQP